MPRVLTLIAEVCFATSSVARLKKAVFLCTVLPSLGSDYLNGMYQGIARICVIEVMQIEVMYTFISDVCYWTVSAAATFIGDIYVAKDFAWTSKLS